MLGNIFFFLVWVFAKSPKALVSLALLFVTFSIRNRTFRFSSPEEGKVDLSVFSYNVMYMDRQSVSDSKLSKEAKGISGISESIGADVKCFQEFYNNDELSSFNMIRRITKENPHYVYMHSNKGNDHASGFIGLATFSKYPIINKEEVFWHINNNGLLASDIVVKGDTIRIINFQLRSMGIRVQKVLGKDRKIDKKETKNILSQLKGGFQERSHQVLILETWIKESPYPVILAGDLNELPYGYAYGKLRKVLHNSFEDAGSGFGFTYRKILRFLRIDNQFYDPKKFKAVHLETFNHYNYSDHYPLLGQYEIID